MKTLAVSWYNRIPPHIKEILEVLKKSGHTSYLAGGCVRDFLLDLSPKDFDIATSATPEEVANKFSKTLDIGKAFGITMIVTEQETVEVARFRADGEYSNHRHPDSIVFSSPQEDAKRRDFTINALFYDPEAELVIDYVGGLVDLENRKIRAVGDPEKRIQEDSLRMLRAVRFAAQLKKKGFELDSEIIPVIQKCSQKISGVSKERVSQELIHILESSHPIVGLELLEECWLWSTIFRFPLPLTGLRKNLDRWQKLFSESPFHPLMATLQSESKSDLSDVFILSAETKKQLQWIKSQKTNLYSPDLALRKTVAQNSWWREALIFGAGDRSDLELRDWVKWREELGSNLNPPPLLTGEELVAMGIEPGPKLGKLLKQLREAQLREEIHTKEEAKKFLQKQS